MDYKITRESTEIGDLLNQCIAIEDSVRSKYPGMTYEQGIRAAIEWLTDEEGFHPLED